MSKYFLNIAVLFTILFCLVISFGSPNAAIAENADKIEGLPITPYTCSYECVSTVEHNYEPEKIRADLHCTSSNSENGSSYAITVSMDGMEGYYPFIKECTITAYYRADEKSEVYSVVYTASGYGDLGKPFELSARVFGKEKDHIFLGATSIADGWYEKSDN
jgi:hypothetical protein